MTVKLWKRLITTVDMVESCIRIALGETADLEPKFHKASAIRYFRVLLSQNITANELTKKITDFCKLDSYQYKKNRNDTISGL